MHVPYLYAPTVNLRTTMQYEDYAMEFTVGDERSSINGLESEYEIGTNIL